MTVRFKSRSEYQSSFRVFRSRSVSPQRCVPLAGLRSDQMGTSREPGLQQRKRLGPGGLAQSCRSLLCPPDPQKSLAEPTAPRTAPPAASRSRSAHRKETSLGPNPPTPPGARLDPGSPADPGPPAGPRPAADPGPPARPRPAADPGPPAGPRPAADPGPPAGPRPAADPGPSVEPGAAGKSVKPHPSKLDSQSQLSRPLTAPDGQQPSANEVQHALRLRAGLGAGLRTGGHRSEYHRQFSWKEPATAASPILTAEQMIRSSRSVPPFKKHPVPLETEYRRSFRGLAPPTEPRLQKHLEHHQRAPLFHIDMTNKKRREESEKKPRPREDVPALNKAETTPPHPPQVQRGHRIPEGGGATDGDARQVMELRMKASAYRRRAWGANFDRDHLSQLLSEHNALWEPTDSTDPPTPRRTFNSRGPAPLEAPDLDLDLDLDLASRSSEKSSSVTSSGDKNTQIKAQTPPSCTAWREEEEEDDEEGRLPTPRLKIRPVQRTHHDLTTPATGGAILVGKLKSRDESSPNKQRCGAAVKQKEAWSEISPTHLPSSSSSGSSPNHKPAASPASKPIRMKQTSPVALAPPPLHCIQGTLRNADFQHNGELGLRFRELQGPAGGCCSDEGEQDDRLSVMSWRSEASCSAASAVLERAQKRREHFWGKR